MPSDYSLLVDELVYAVSKSDDIVLKLKTQEILDNHKEYASCSLSTREELDESIKKQSDDMEKHYDGFS